MRIYFFGHAFVCLFGLRLLFGVTLARAADPPLTAADLYDYVLSTQTIGASYQFTKENRLVETAHAIREMGANTIKLMLPDGKGGTGPKSLVEAAGRDPSIKAVLDMPFANYVLWTYAISGTPRRFEPDELADEYREIHDLTRYLLTTYAGSGKTFYLGNWEGDWLLLHVNANYVPTTVEVKNMIAWVNTRQRAVDDARHDTPHAGVEVYHYLEVNRVVDAKKGLVRMTDDVLPHTPVDFVSYSSYDSISGNIETDLKNALDYIESKLPPKPPLIGKRVFIGEYGFAAARYSGAEQDARSRRVMRVGLAWGCPFVLYWEMYNNEVKAGRQMGYWLIDDHGAKQPVYFTHERFLARARRFVSDFQARMGRPPTRAEFNPPALEWLKEDP